MTYQEINQCKSIENLPNEIFKDIPEYEGLYQVSNLGRVKSLNRIKINESSNQFTTFICKRNFKEKIVSYAKESNGYLRVTLCNGDKSKRFSIHRLVMLAFKGYSDLTVNHKDTNKQNNKFKNLEYCTQKENVAHAIKTGLKNSDFLKIKIKQYDLQGNFIRVWDSIKEASKSLNIYHISACINNKRNTAGGFIWKKF